MKSLSNSMESTRHFLREETHHATCISISILSFIKITVKRETYLCTIPQTIWKEMEEEKEATKKKGKLTKKQQQQLDFKMITGPHEFMRAGTLHTVTVLIATNYQVSY